MIGGQGVGLVLRTLVIEGNVFGDIEALGSVPVGGMVAPHA